MYQKKYNPEESLQRIKLMMGYSLKKTLKENAQTTGVVLSEQIIGAPAYVAGTNTPTTKYSPEQVIGNEIASAAGGAGTDEDGLVEAVEKINNSKEFWNINSYLKTIGSKLDFAGIVNDEMDNEDGKYVQRIINHLKKIGINSTADINEYNNFKPNTFVITSTGVSKVETKKDGSSKKIYSPCPAGDYKKGCKSDVVKKVQACLGMAAKYQTGNFGPITQGELKKLGKGFENGFKDADVEVICAKTQQPTKPSGVEELEPNNAASQNEPF